MSNEQKKDIRSSAESLHWINFTLGKILKEMQRQNDLIERGASAIASESHLQGGPF